MTLKELLDRCDFKDIAPCIAEWYPEEAVNMNQYLHASANIRYGYDTDENLNTEISLLLLASH